MNCEYYKMINRKANKRKEKNSLLKFVTGVNQVQKEFYDIKENSAERLTKLQLAYKNAADILITYIAENGLEDEIYDKKFEISLKVSKKDFALPEENSKMEITDDLCETSSESGSSAEFPAIQKDLPKKALDNTQIESQAANLEENKKKQFQVNELKYSLTNFKKSFSLFKIVFDEYQTDVNAFSLQNNKTSKASLKQDQANVEERLKKFENEMLVLANRVNQLVNPGQTNLNEVPSSNKPVDVTENKMSEPEAEESKEAKKSGSLLRRFSQMKMTLVHELNFRSESDRKSEEADNSSKSEIDKNDEYALPKWDSKYYQ